MRVARVAPFFSLISLVAASLAFAQPAHVDVQSAAGALDREQALRGLDGSAESLGACFGDPAGVLATLRVNRSGVVASVRFMESSGDEGIDRCVSRVLREARFERASGRTTLYVVVRVD